MLGSCTSGLYTLFKHMFGLLKRQGRIVTGFEKTVPSCPSLLNLAAARLWLKHFFNAAWSEVDVAGQFPCYRPLERFLLGASEIVIACGSDRERQAAEGDIVLAE